MKNIIELKPKWYPFYAEEEFEEIIPVVNPFFNHGGSHLDAPISLLPNGIFVYAKRPYYFDPEEHCKHCKTERERITFNITNQNIPDVFYDTQNKIYFCKTIFLNDRYTGEYCPRINCLWLTDWTHNKSCLSLAMSLLPQIFEKLQVKKVNINSQKKNNNCKITLGVDAEFEEMTSWRTYTPVATSYEEDLDSEIGTDGSGWQIEIRPAPAYTPSQLVKNIKKLINQISQPISVLGNRFPLGCHIHIGLPKELIGYESCFVELLDKVLGEKIINLSGTARGNYKEVGAYETKKWGFEYRTPPSAILLNPKIAKIVLKIVKNTIEYLIRHEKIEIYDNYTENLRKYAKLTNKEINYFLDFINNYWNYYDGHAINQYWNKTKIKKDPEFIFYDEWDDDIKDYIKKQFETKYWKNKLNGYRIIFYGLRKERGMVVAGFKSKHATTIDHPVDYVPKFQFGLPRHIRTFELLDKKEVFRILKDMIKEIKEQLKKYC